MPISRALVYTFNDDTECPFEYVDTYSVLAFNYLHAEEKLREYIQIKTPEQGNNMHLVLRGRLISCQNREAYNVTIRSSFVVVLMTCEELSTVRNIAIANDVDVSHERWFGMILAKIVSKGKTRTPDDCSLLAFIDI